MPKKIDKVFYKIKKELINANKYPNYNSAHEGYAVILEELDELWDQVRLKEKNRCVKTMRIECIQIATTAIRFYINLL